MTSKVLCYFKNLKIHEALQMLHHSVYSYRVGVPHEEIHCTGEYEENNNKKPVDTSPSCRLLISVGKKFNLL